MLRDRLAAIPGVRVLDRGERLCAIVTIDASGRDASELSAALGRRGINTSASLRWYGLIDFGEKGSTGALRLSPHYYNSDAELDSAIGALEEILAAH
jgi:selenocysteine lyase/cysteine desulfurase